MLITEFGIVSVLNEVQSSNAKSPMLVTESGIVIELNIQYSNAQFPILKYQN